MIQIIPFIDSHKEPIENILRETNAFRADEIAVALELIDDYLAHRAIGSNNFDPENYQLYTATEGDTVLGYACFGKTPMTLSAYDLYWIAVAPDSHGRGIGKMLFDFTCLKVAEQGGNLVVIETSSQPHYERARKFYEKIGCELEGHIKNFYRLGDDKLIYVKHL